MLHGGRAGRERTEKGIAIAPDRAQAAARARRLRGGVCVAHAHGVPAPLPACSPLVVAGGLRLHKVGAAARRHRLWPLLRAVLTKLGIELQQRGVVAAAWASLGALRSTRRRGRELAPPHLIVRLDELAGLAGPQARERRGCLREGRLLHPGCAPSVAWQRCEVRAAAAVVAPARSRGGPRDTRARACSTQQPTAASAPTHSRAPAASAACGAGAHARQVSAAGREFQRPRRRRASQARIPIGAATWACCSRSSACAARTRALACGSVAGLRVATSTRRPGR